MEPCVKGIIASLLPPKALAADERGQNQGEKPDRSVAAETTHTKHPARGPQLSGAAHLSSLVRLHGAAPLMALIYLCCGGVTVAPPLR